MEKYEKSDELDELLTFKDLMEYFKASDKTITK